MRPEFLPTTPEARLYRLIEECSEVIKEACKVGRFGRDSGFAEYGPLTNGQRLLAEIIDLKHAIEDIEQDLKQDAAP